MADFPFSNNSVNPTPFLWGNVDGGPTFGWVRRPLFAQRIITAAGNVAVAPMDMLIIVKKTIPAITTITLPDVDAWMKSPFGGTPLIFKDGSNNASSFNITLTPFGSQKIDGLSNMIIGADGASVLLRPMVDISGWVS